MTDIPAGFVPHDTTSPFIRHVGPLYVCASDVDLRFGLRVAEAHCNRSGRLHGGMVSTLLDIAFGNNIGYALQRERRFCHIHRERWCAVAPGLR